MRFRKLERSLSLIWLLPHFATSGSLERFEDECASSFAQGLRISKALLGGGAGAVVLYAPAYERDPLKMRCTKELTSRGGSRPGEARYDGPTALAMPFLFASVLIARSLPTPPSKSPSP